MSVQQGGGEVLAGDPEVLWENGVIVQSTELYIFTCFKNLKFHI